MIAVAQHHFRIAAAHIEFVARDEILTQNLTPVENQLARHQFFLILDRHVAHEVALARRAQLFHQFDPGRQPVDPHPGDVSHPVRRHRKTVVDTVEFHILEQRRQLAAVAGHQHTVADISAAMDGFVENPEHNQLAELKALEHPHRLKQTPADEALNHEIPAALMEPVHRIAQRDGALFEAAVLIDDQAHRRIVVLAELTGHAVGDEADLVGIIAHPLHRGRADAVIAMTFGQAQRYGRTRQSQLIGDLLHRFHDTPAPSGNEFTHYRAI
ncbi:hypothetical protein SDC9_124670 [bioreactor metagenome]|uniref:Uncharacterized protein n=1 Tax=bioreactor metagenome TaxID=1076179 RepID=A0A645CLL9_9ZZZZ